MENSLEDIIRKPLSDSELLKLVDGKARLITHDKIGNFRSIDELLGPHKACIILYVLHTDEGSINGHWTCVFKAGWQPDCISYFDSYGKVPDNPLTFISPQAKQEYGNQKILSQMLKDDGRLVVFNTYPLQHKDRDINVCGRLVALRLNMREIDGFEFVDIMTSTSKNGLPSDALSSLLTCWV